METIDDLTSQAIAEETAGPATTTAPVPEQPAAAPAEPAAAPVQKDEFVGSFEEPDYMDVISDKDRLEEAEIPAEEAQPLDPVIPASAPAPAAVETPAPPAPASVPQSGEPPQVPAAAAPAVPAVPAAPVPAAPTPEVVPSPEEQAAAQALLQENVLKELTKLYQFSPEEAAKLDEFEQKPSEYLPTLLAKAHLQAQAQAYQTVMQSLPAVIDRITTVRQAEQKAEDAFLSRWPELKEHPQVAVKAIQTFKQMNPQATMEEAIERAGMLAMISIGKTPGSGQPPAPAPETSAPPPRPAMPGGGSGLRPTAPVSYEEAVFDEIVRSERNYGRG